MSEHTLLQESRDVRRISNSEVSTLLACEMKYFFEFDMNLQLKERKNALFKGILLHDALKAYYEVIMNAQKDFNYGPEYYTYTSKEAHNAARSVLMTAMRDDTYPQEIIQEVDVMVRNYAARYGVDEDWEILGVEQSVSLPLTDEFEYPLRYDLLVRSKSTNKKWLVDHKTAYNFWTDIKYRANAQFPKYVGVLRANGTFVEGVIVNQLRTRVIKNPTTEQLFQRTPVTYSREKIANSLREQILGSQRVMARRELPLEVREATSLRVLNPQICDWCAVSELCLSKLDGGDITTMIASDFQQREDYGYNVEEMVEI
jgi:hypothetical protein